MKKEEIWQMALASGLCDADLSSDDHVCTDYGDATEAVEKFAAMVSAWAIAEEREACAALCERLCLDGLGGHEYADAIRKRSNAIAQGREHSERPAGAEG